MIRTTIDGENMRCLILALPLLTSACVYADTFEKLFDPAPYQHGQVNQPTPAEAEERRLQELEVQRQAEARTQEFAAEQAKEPPIRHSATRYRIRRDRAIACRSVKALLALSEPDARERLGDMNWTRIATLGECDEIGNSRPLMICYTTERVSFMAQIFQTPTGEVAGRCYFMLTQGLADSGGNAPPAGISN